MTEFKQTEGARASAAYGDAITSAMLREAVVWADAQRELLSGAEAIWSDWLKRRSEAVEATSRSMQKIWECRNLAEVAQAQHDWLTGAVDRVAADLTSVASGTAILTRRVGEIGRSSKVLSRPGWPPASPEPAHSGMPEQTERAAAE
jgi:hypothetical protein